MIRTLLALLTGALLAAAPAAAGPPIPSGLEEIVFATRQAGPGGHWYENFGYAAGDASEKLYRPFGRLCKLNLRTGALTLLIDDPAGTVRDPQVHYDGRKILFSYRPGDTEYFHLYEIGADGAGLRQLTDGPYDDIEPSYLPDGRIMLCSSRCRRWVNCWSTQVANLYVCDAGGGNMMPVSANIEQDNHPWPLPDGRVIYTRWEYVDRSRTGFHHLWTANPDGTGQMVYYGNMRYGTLMIDAKPIPGTDKVVAIFSPGHGKREHMGAVTIVTPKTGPDDPGAARQLSAAEDCRDPYPLSENAFLVAQGASVLLMDAAGQTRELYKLPKDLIKEKVEVHEPRPLAARPRERVIPARVDVAQATGRLILNDVNVGRNMAGVKPGTIKKLLVLETLPKPVNDSGKMPPMSFGGTYTLNRILGTVPVAPDGSAVMEVPALRSLFFIALDEHNNTVKRMMSFLTVLPGETMSCVGCHEQRTRTPQNVSVGGGALLALKRPPSRIEPLPGIPDVIDTPRDIQPILDRHCLKCHDTNKREGGVILSGDRGPVYSLSYFELTALGYVSDGRDRVATSLPPYAIGTSASPLMKLIDGSHYGAKLSQHEQDMIRYWIESSAPYPGTYAALDNGMIGGYPHSKLDTTEQGWPEAVAAAEALGRRCAACHDKSMPLPRSLSDDMGLILSNPREDDPRIRWSRHRMFNLTRPDQSLILLAPLAKEAGGYGLCRMKEMKENDASTSQQSLSLAPRFNEGSGAQKKNKKNRFNGFSPKNQTPSEVTDLSGSRVANQQRTTQSRRDGTTSAPPFKVGISTQKQSGVPEGRHNSSSITLPVFASTVDPDYQKILTLCRAGQAELDRIRRFDMPGFVPPAHYVRELKRFGILPAAYDGQSPIDVYAADQAYWKSHWWTPQLQDQRHISQILPDRKEANP